MSNVRRSIKEVATVDSQRGDPAREERGQILVIFALALIVIIGMVGLVLDGGSAFAQRRAEQNAADLAAIAGANAYLHESQSGAGNHVAWQATAKAAAFTAATRNGYSSASGATVNVPDFEVMQSGYRVRVNITATHTNTFARVLGANSWDVSVTAAAITGSIDTAVGAAPWTMHINAFNANGTPKYGQSNPQNFGETNGDYPTSQLDIAWTDFNGNNNVNTNEVRGIIDGSNVVTATFDFDQYLGQHNQGNHTALYTDVHQHLAGHTVPVPIVGPGPCTPGSQAGGCFVGWAMFYVISADGGSSKHIRGYFTGNFTQTPLSVGECPTPNDPAASGCGIITAGGLDRLIVRLDD
jgi:Flp pilus assembly protein TadG